MCAGSAATSLFVICLACPAAGEVAIGGKVTGDGQALRQARVSLLPVPRQGLADPGPVAETASDARGLFHLDAPEPGMWKVRVEATGRAPQEYVLAPLLEAVELPAVDLEPVAVLEVRLTDPRGRPVQGRVSVFAGDDDLRRSRRRRPPGLGVWQPPHFVETTGEAGTVRVPASGGERTWVIEAAAAGSLPARREAAGSRLAAGVEMVLRPGHGRAIAVVDERGQPLAGTQIFEDDGNLPLAVSGDGGRATLAAGGEPLALVLTAPGGYRGFHRLEPRRSDEVETVRLAAPRTLAGRVVDRDGRRPIAGALVWTQSAGPGVHAATDAQGTYELRLPEAAEDLLFAAAAGYARETVALLRGAAAPTVALAPAASVSGVVVDAAGGPLGAVEVTAKGAGRRPRSFELGGLHARSTEQGRFRLAGLPADGAYELRFSKDGLTPARLTVEDLRPFETRTGLRVVLHEGRQGRGRVVDENDAPVAGAEVRLVDSEGRSRFAVADEEPPAHLSDAAGRFEIPDLAAGRYDLAAAAAGFAPTSVPGVEIPPGEGDVDLGVVILVPGAAIAGRVIDSEGAPVAGAEIRARAAASRRGSGWPLPERDGPPQATSGADGGFVVADRRPGERLDLSVDKEGFVRGRAAGVVAPTAEPVEVVLRPASRVSGRVLDEDGEPVAAATVEVRPEGHGGSGGSALRFAGYRLGTSAEDGRFEVADVEPGRVTVAARAVGFERAQLSGLEAPAGDELRDVVLTLRRGVTLAGRVVGADGTPAVGAYVSVAEPAARLASRTRESAVSDGDGRYEVPGLGLGLYTVAAEHEGARASKSVEIGPGDNVVDLVLDDGVEVSGRVVDGVGAPVAAARVYLTGDAGGYRRAWPGTTSAGDGSFTLRGVAPGSYRLAAAKEGLAPAESEETIEVASAPLAGLEVRLRPGTTVQGRVLGLEYDELVAVVVGAVGAPGDPVRTDYEGRFAIPDLAPGEVTVRAEIPGTGRQAQERVTIEEGVPVATVDLEFGAGYTLTGVAVHGGDPVPGAGLRLAGAGHAASTSTDEGGAFRFEGLPAGLYRLVLLSYDGGLRHEEEVEIAGDRDLRLEIATGRVAGRVRDSLDSSPVEGAAFALEATAGGGPRRWRATSDARGAFSLGEVPEGVWKLVVSKPGYADLETAVDVRAGGFAELDLAFEATGRLTFEVTLPSGEPPSAVRVAALDGGGRRVGGGVYGTTDGGRVSLTTLPPGTWELLIVADRSATLRVRATVPGRLGRVALPPGGDLRVTVGELRDDGVAAALRLVGPDGRRHQEVGWQGGVSSQWSLSQGRRTTSNLAPGSWTVEVTAADGRVWSGSAMVAPGATAEVDLP